MNINKDYRSAIAVEGNENILDVFFGSDKYNSPVLFKMLDAQLLNTWE